MMQYFHKYSLNNHVQIYDNYFNLLLQINLILETEKLKIFSFRMIFLFLRNMRCISPEIQIINKINSNKVLLLYILNGAFFYFELRAFFSK